MCVFVGARGVSVCHNTLASLKSVSQYEKCTVAAVVSRTVTRTAAVPGLSIWSNPKNTFKKTSVCGGFHETGF